MVLRIQRPQAGFTLIELLIVVAVIGLIAAIAIPNLLHALHKARQKRSMGEVRTIGSGLAMYQRDNAFYPILTNSNAGVLHPDLIVYVGNFNKLDGWSTLIGYTSDGSQYTLVSYGKNKTADLPIYNGPTVDFDSDIVFSEGVFVQWPEGSQN